MRQAGQRVSYLDALGFGVLGLPHPRRSCAPTAPKPVPSECTLRLSHTRMGLERRGVRHPQAGILRAQTASSPHHHPPSSACGALSCQLSGQAPRLAMTHAPGGRRGMPWGVARPCQHPSTPTPELAGFDVTGASEEPGVLREVGRSPPSGKGDTGGWCAVIVVVVVGWDRDFP